MFTSREVFGLNVYHIIIDGLYDAIPIFLAFIVLSLGAGEQDVGSIVSLIALFSTIASIGTVYLLERYNILLLTAFIVLLYGGGYVLAAFSTALYQVGIAFILATIGHQIFHNVAFTYFSDTALKNKIGRAISDFTAIGDIGRIPFISLAGLCGIFAYRNIEGWRVVLFLYGFITILLLVLSYKFFIPSGKKSTYAQAGTGKSLPSLNLLLDKRVFLTVVANMLNVLSCGALFVFLPMLLLAKGFDPKILGGLGLGFSVGCFLGKIACGRLIDRYGSSKIFIASHLILTLLLWAIIQNNSLDAILLISLMIGFVTKGSIPIVQTIVIQYIPNEYYKDIFSINTFFRGIILIIIPFMYGLISAQYGITQIYIIMAISSLLAILPILGIGLVNFFQEKD